MLIAKNVLMIGQQEIIDVLIIAKILHIKRVLKKAIFKCDKCDGEILYDNVKKHSEICKSEKVQKINIARLKRLDRNEVKGINDKEKKDITYITCKS